MATLQHELIEWLYTLDEVSLLELLDISSEELVDQFGDKIEENYSRLMAEKERM